MINVEYDKSISLDEANIKWQYDDVLNCHKKIFSLDEDKETSLIKFDKDSNFKNSKRINSVEIFILAGTYSNEFGDFEKGTYLKLPKEDESKITTSNNCEIFKKINYSQNTIETSIVDTSSSQWLQGQGNLQVMPLSDQTALVKWPKDEIFIPHTHWGGEEILVLKGTFIDEHGEYKIGTWLRSPHLSRHHPYVKEETIIFVKTGHL